MKRPLIILSILFLLVIPVLSDFSQVELDTAPVDEKLISYVEHPTFTVVGNDDFVTNFSGLGTAEQPYTFEGRNITGADALINITDTDAYCVIRDCFFRTVTGEPFGADAIVLDNASHVTIEGCIFYNVSKIVEATGSSNLTIIDAYSYDIRASSIYLTNCPYANLTGNTVQGSYWTGIPDIKLTGCNYSHIIGNNVTWSRIQIINSNETNAIDNILFRSMLYLYTSIDVVAEYNTFDGNDGKDCIQILSCSQCNISHNSVANQLINGITVSESAEVILRNNTVYSSLGKTNNDYGILIEDSLDCTVQNNTVSNNNDIAGIGILYSNNTIVRDNIAFYNNYGYYDRGTLDTKFNNCIAYDNWDDGYSVWQSNRTELDYCNSSANEGDGFYIHECYESQVRFCFSEFNEHSGFAFSFDNDTFIWECRAYDNAQTFGYEGYEINYSNHTQIWWTIAEGNSGREFYFRECYYGLVKLSGISDAGGIALSSCNFFEFDNLELYRSGSIGMVDVTNVTVSDSSFQFNRGHAIYVESSTNVTLIRNTIDDNYSPETNYEGIYVEDSSDVTIKDNQITNMDDAAIYLDQSTACYLDNNTLDSGGLYVEGELREYWFHEITLDNTVLGKSIYYLVNESDVNYDLTSAGQVFIVDSENVSTTGGSLTKSIVGYVMAFSSNCSVSSLLIDGCRKGLLFFYSEDCNVISSQFYYESYNGVAVSGDHSTSMNITDCYAEGYGTGFHLQYSDNSIINKNEALNITHDGISIQDSYDCIVTNNTMSKMSDNAIYASWSDNIRLEDNILVDDIEDAIQLYRCQNFSIIDNEIVASDVGISLSSISSGILEANMVQGNSACIRLFSSRDLEIYSNTFSSTGIIIINNDNIAYYNHTMTGNTVGGLPIGYFKNQHELQIDASDYGQIFLLYCENSTIKGHEMAQVSIPLYLASCYNVTVANYSLSDVYDGLRSYNSTHCSIENFTVTESARAGLYLTQSHNASLSNVNSSFSEYYGLYLYQSEDSVILNSEVWNCSKYSIYAENSHDLQIEGLNVINSTKTGLYLYGSDGVAINDTLVIDCDHGLNLYRANNCNVTNSGFFNNSLGVLVQSSTNNLFYLNEFGGNSDNNAQDDSAGNFWDDDVMYGNTWSDYYGGGIYEVPGTGGSIDGFPNSLPGYTIVISNPANQTFNEGSVGNSITWTSPSSYIRSYQVYMNESFQFGGLWTGGPVVVNLNGLSPGYYCYTIYLTSYFASSNHDAVVIEVIEITTPTIDHPADFWYWYGDKGNTIMWDAASSDPDFMEVYLNDTYYGPYGWDGSSVEGIMDGYDVGVYNVTIIVYSRCGNNASDTVFMTVRARSIPEIDQPEDFWYWYSTDGHSVVWNASCTYPDSFEFYINGTIEASGPWDGTDIEIDVDGLSVGLHYLTLFVYSQSNNQTYDTVLLTVKTGTIPEIDQPEDFWYWYGSNGNLVSWDVSSQYPNSFEFYVNGTLENSGEWDGTDIEIDVDDFAVGVYNLTLVVFSDSNNCSSDTVFLTVMALSTPEINHPDDVSFTEGSEGESITWIVSDSYPDSYEILLNGSVSASGEWDGSNIVVSLDGLDVGIYNFTLIVYSECGLFSSDSVIVTVTSSDTTTTSTTTTTDTTTDTTTETTDDTTETTTTSDIPTDDGLGTIIIVAGAGGGIIVLVMAVMLLRKRQSG